MENRIDIEGYKKVLDKTLDESREMLILLQQKVTLTELRKTDNGLTIIEDRISVIKTKGEIKVLSRIIEDKQKYFVKYFEQFSKDAADCNEHWDFILNRAKMERNKNNLINGILSTMEADMAKVYAEPEIKLGYYKTLKKQLNNEAK